MEEKYNSVSPHFSSENVAVVCRLGVKLAISKQSKVKPKFQTNIFKLGKIINKTLPMFSLV